MYYTIGTITSYTYKTRKMCEITRGGYFTQIDKGFKNSFVADSRLVEMLKTDVKLSKMERNSYI